MRWLVLPGWFLLCGVCLFGFLQLRLLFVDLSACETLCNVHNMRLSLLHWPVHKTPLLAHHYSLCCKYVFYFAACGISSVHSLAA